MRKDLNSDTTFTAYKIILLVLIFLGIHTKAINNILVSHRKLFYFLQNELLIHKHAG